MATVGDTIHSIVVDPDGTIYIEQKGVRVSPKRRWFPATHAANQFEVRVTTSSTVPANGTLTNPLSNWTTVIAILRVTAQFTSIDEAAEWVMAFTVSVRRKAYTSEANSGIVILSNNIIAQEGGLVEGFDISARGSVNQDGDGSAGMTINPDGTFITSEGGPQTTGYWYDGDVGPRTFEYFVSNVTTVENNGDLSIILVEGAWTALSGPISVGADGRFGVGPGPGRVEYAATIQFREVGNPSNSSTGTLSVIVD